MEPCPRSPVADFTEYRRQRDCTAWKYAMWDAGLRLPTQSPDGSVPRTMPGLLSEEKRSPQESVGLDLPE